MSRHLFTVFDQDRSFWERALSLAKSYKENPFKTPQKFSSKKIGLLFFEPSSRTRWSFERAALDLGARPMVSVVDQSTSLSKGEEHLDTLELYLNLNFDLVVVRAPHLVGFSEKIQSYSNCAYINAGFGSESHPTQAFLDCFTWAEQAPGLIERVLFMGDLSHSRVVKSHLRLSKVLGYKVGLLASKGCELSEEDASLLEPDLIFTKRSEALDWAQVITSLRTQKERHSKTAKVEALEPLCAHEVRADQFVMHPGPFVRGEDLESSLVHDSRSLIFKQKQNGVFCRAALMSMMLEE